MLVQFLVRYYGDLAVHSPEQLLTNWPNFLYYVPGHIGWAIGLMVGVGVYYVRHGQFRYGSSLFLHMALGWFAAFLALPVLLDLRMTPPRGDNWAGVLGAFIGLMKLSQLELVRSPTIAGPTCQADRPCPDSGPARRRSPSGAP